MYNALSLQTFGCGTSFFQEVVMDYADLGNRLQTLLGLQRQAVAIAFLDKAPAGVPRVRPPRPASCSYWKLASEGEVFHTTADDHRNCTIGAHTHGVSLSPEKAAELQATIGQMIGLSYLRPEEVPQIPHRTEPFQVAVYSPLAQSPCEPQIVLIRGNARQFMLLTEAVIGAGIDPSRMRARPTCAFLPDTLQTGRATPSLACIGNRVYTDMGNDELYYAIPALRVAELVAALEKIVVANQALERFHQARCAIA
jgi:uncharacterized protein (DUF169 family)